MRHGELAYPGVTASFTVRPAAPADAMRLTELATRTFRDAFGAQNRPENIEAYVAATYGPELQAAELRDPARATLLVEMEASLIGYAQLREGPAPSVVRGPAPIELLRFYVDRPWHGRGVAPALMGAVIELARSRGGGTLWLGVWEQNPRAIAFYAKSGFADVGSQPFQLGTDLQRDRVMSRPLGSD